MNLNFSIEGGEVFIKEYHVATMRPFSIVSVWELMEKFDAGKLFISIAGLSNLAHGFPGKGSFAIPHENYIDIKDKIDFICFELERMNLSMSLTSARHLHQIIHKEYKEQNIEPHGNLVLFQNLSADRYRNYARELLVRFKDELSTKMVLIMPYNKAGYFDGSISNFPDEVRSKFSLFAYDMDEVDKCFALSRYTACVFHLMRIMEYAVQQIGISLTANQNIVEENWQNIVDRIRKEIRTRFPREKSPERIRWESLLGHLETVKIAWRNPTMHPKQSYSEDEAVSIIAAVRFFIQELAKII